MMILYIHIIYNPAAAAAAVLDPAYMYKHEIMYIQGGMSFDCSRGGLLSELGMPHAPEPGWIYMGFSLSAITCSSLTHRIHIYHHLEICVFPVSTPGVQSVYKRHNGSFLVLKP